MLSFCIYERIDECTAYRNGFRNRQLTTRVGHLNLRVPRHWNGDSSTELFERYQRSEQALVLAMMEMVVNIAIRKPLSCLGGGCPVPESACGSQGPVQGVADRFWCRRIIDGQFDVTIVTSYPV